MLRFLHHIQLFKQIFETLYAGQAVDDGWMDREDGHWVCQCQKPNPEKVKADWKQIQKLKKR